MALVAVPSHRIHGAFGAPSFASLSSSGSSAAAHLQASFAAQPNVSYAPARARAAPLSILAARTAAAAAHQAPPTPVTTRPRRPSFRSVALPVSTRRAPPPPARTSPASASASAAAQDPFADSPECAAVAAPRRFAATGPAPAPKMLTLTYSTYAYPAVSTPRAPARDADRTSRLVASVLLSRTNGRPLRRRLPLPCAGEDRERAYVPSCLSRMVEVEC